MEKLTYSITGLTIDKVRLIEAADSMRDALLEFLKWNDQPAKLPSDGIREQIANTARVALKKGRGTARVTLLRRNDSRSAGAFGKCKSQCQAHTELGIGTDDKEA